MTYRFGLKKRKRGIHLFMTRARALRGKSNGLLVLWTRQLYQRIESHCSEDAMLVQSSSASIKLGNFFVAKEERKASEITVRSPDLSEKFATVTEVRSNLVFGCNVLQCLLSTYAVCKFCKRGNLKIWDRDGKSCFAYYLTLRCDTCGRGEDFWTVSGKFGSKIDIAQKKVTKRNDTIYQSVFGGRIIGVGRRALNVYHAMLGLGFPPHKFNSVREDLLVTIEFIAKGTMERVTIELEDSYGIAEDGLIHEIASFDGAYQKRSTKGGGGYSRYSFGSVISMTLGKILAYEVACNSCRECTRLANMVENNTIDKEEYDILVESHKSICPPKYAEFASVCLESELSIVILEQALGRGIIFDGLVLRWR